MRLLDWRFWTSGLPLLGLVAMIAWPIGRYAQMRHAESVALAFVGSAQAAQATFRSAGGRGGYATSVESLITPCAVGDPVALLAEAASAVRAAGYEIRLRGRDGAPVTGTDCHGRPVAEDYYIGLQPRAAAIAAQRAFAATSQGPVFLFFDGIAPLERDMTAGGMATPTDALATFRIP